MNADERSESSERSSAAVDRLVREHLDRVAATVDATRLIDRLRETSSPPTPKSRTKVAQSFAWAVPAVAALVVAFLLGRWIEPSAAEASTALNAARAVQRKNVDRLYRGTFHPDPSYWDGKNVLRGPSETILWTRGDRFWADTRFGTVRLVYGRDEEGSLWLSPSRSSGIRFSTSDVPDEIDAYCAINAMTASRLLDDVLADFDLRICDLPEAASGVRSTGGRTTILATLKPGRSHPFLSSALLEIDGADALVRLILWTVDDGRPRGTVTYTLADATHLDDAVYRLPYHLDADAKVSDGQFPPSDEKAAPPAAEE